MRTPVRDARKAATVAGFGPRFLHSTGQVYKGGPKTGVFLVITRDSRPDVAIPGHKAHFGQVQIMQARGDTEVLAQRGQRALRVHLKAEGGGIDALKAAVVLIDSSQGLNHADRSDRPRPHGRETSPAA